MINSDNSIQINIKFTFTIHEYIIVYEYILFSNLIYIYIYIYSSLSLAEKAYPIVNMTQVINKEARATS